jgi:SAM-dependent methyltransferase
MKINNKLNFETLCPLCKGNSILIHKTFKAQHLKNIYKKAHNYDISYLLKDIDNIQINECSTCKLIYFTPSITGDELFYNALQSTIQNYYYDDKFEYRVIQMYFSKEIDILEIGAGKGAFSKQIEFKSYTGLELSEKAINIANDKNIVLKNQKIQDYIACNPNEKFDIVVSFQVLEHIDLEELHSFISSSLFALKKGGKFIIAVPAQDSFVGKLPNSSLNLPPHHVTRWKDFTLNKLAEIFELKIISVTNEPLKTKNFSYFIQYFVFKMHSKIIQKHVFFNKVVKKMIQYLIPLSIKTKLVNLNKNRDHSIIVVYQKN